MSSSNQTKSDITHIVLSVLFIGILILASVWIFLPFLMVLLLSRFYRESFWSMNVYNRDTRPSRSSRKSVPV